MPVYDFTEIVDETIASTHPDPTACKIICKMLASNRVDVTVMKELEDSEEACNELYPVPEDPRAEHRPVPGPHRTEEVILSSDSSQGLEFFGLGCSL